MMPNPNYSRKMEQVKEAYTEMLRRSENSCCGNSEASSAVRDYSQNELASLPPEAVQSSFGCGNPLQFAGVKPGQTVLDIGSGAGIDCFLAADKVGPKGRVIGLDMTSAMIEKARDIGKAKGYKNVEFRLGRADQMPVDNASVDWIISNCVINLAPDKPAVFREAFRALKPGGELSISDIVLGGELPEKIRDSVEAYVGCVAGAVKEEEYLEAMRQAGFTDVRVTSRFVYGKEHVEGFLSSLESGSSSCGCGAIPKDAAEVIGQLDGKVWSAQISAKKPKA